MAEDNDKLKKLEEMGIDIGGQKDQAEQIKALKDKIMRKILSKGARERLGNIRVANPQLALQVEMYLMQLHQAGQIRKRITEDQLKQILNAITKKKDTSIKRK